MGNQAFNPCPSELNMQKEFRSQIIVPRIKEGEFKHTIQIVEPSEIYKKSLRKDLNTIQMAEEIMIDLDLDKCFKEDFDSMILTKATQDSINRRQFSLYPKKIISKGKPSNVTKNQK